MITIHRSAEVDKSWDRYVESHPRATVAHLSLSHTSEHAIAEVVLEQT